MNRYAMILKDHLKENHPEKFRRMKKIGELDLYLNLRSKAVLEQKQTMLESGMPDNMAEEIAIRDLMAV